LVNGRLGLVASIANSGGAFPFAQWPCAITRLQLRGSAGFAPASRTRER